MPLLHFQNVDYGVGGPLLLDHVDLSIEPGLSRAMHAQSEDAASHA